ncbi:MAG TPA: hypothetical protein VHX88_06440 [Solirubrobacteraceae bacterium]|jgi:hypothetical protein|nr:hypothetical protein [Solirubrobacteraceae bacterium]
MAMHRQRFFFNLGMVGAATLLIVASVAFGPNAIKGIGIGIGSAGGALCLWFISAAVHHRRLAGHPVVRAFRRTMGLWTLLAAAMATVAAWEVIQTCVFGATPMKWLTLANGLLLDVLGCVGLVAHELCSERVVHCLEVVERPTAY